MPDNIKDTSAIIIGAGPAGAATSFFLTRNSIPHVVIDKEVFPRDKVCGDACSGKTALVINRANPEWLDEIFNTPAGYLPSWGITFVAPNGKSLDVPFSPGGSRQGRAPGFTVPRLDFDHFLFRKMASPYCTIVQGADVTAIERKAGNVEVHFNENGRATCVSAPLIVGADGDKSIVRKKFAPAPQLEKAYAVGLRSYYEGITGMHPDNFIELHFLPEMLPGYLWIFPLPGGMANVGVGILSSQIRKKKINLREQMLCAIKNNPAIAPRFEHARLAGKIQGWGLPLANGRRSVSGDNYLLTGDAASLIDPFSGEGIGNAMYSGMLAAGAIKNALDQGNYTSELLQREYDDVLYKRLGDEFRISATLQRLCNYPWLFNFVVSKAHKSPSLRQTISGMFTDMDLRSRLGKPSFYFNILMNK